MDIYKDVGYRIVELRASKGLTQEQLAEILGVSREMMVYYEGGKRKIKYDTLVKIADYFNVSTDYLLGRTKVSTTDMNLQGICDYVNLSEKAVNNIADFTELSVPFCCLSAGAIFNKLCETGDIFELCSHILSYYEITDLISLYKMKIAEKKRNNEDYSEYERLVNSAKTDCDYFKWNISNYVNQITECITNYFNKGNSKRDIDESIAYYGDIQEILKRHNNIVSNWVSIFNNSQTDKERENNGEHNPPKK